MSKAKPSLQKEVVSFLRLHQRKWVGYCDVADREGMPNMKAFYSKKIKAAELIIDTFSDFSSKPQENKK